jgi:hypothetical protein
VALMAASIFALASAGIARGALNHRRQGILWGASVGVLVGVALGSWVGSILHVIPLQIALGLLVARSGWLPMPGLVPLGVALHLAAFLTALPAIMQSPWNRLHPWSVVNLTWFHGAWLAAGVIALLPLLAVGLRSIVTRVFPLFILVGLACLAMIGRASEFPVALGIREGFDWMERQDAFMRAVWEARPVGLHEAGALMGLGFYLLPLITVGAAWTTFRRDRFELLPWLLFATVLGLEVTRQYRFTQTFSVPLSVLLGWGLVTSFRLCLSRVRVNQRRLLAVGGIVAAVLALPIAHRNTMEVITAGSGNRLSPADVTISNVVRELSSKIREISSPGDYSVLANWGHGHAIEWLSGKPTVATNFALYIGDESFRDPARFFLAEDRFEAERILEERRVRYVLITAWFPRLMAMRSLGADQTRLDRYLDRTEEADHRLTFAWFRTMSARLMFDGSVIHEKTGAGPPMDFMRLVAVSMKRYPELIMGMPRPAGWVWEAVRGAVIEVRAKPGDRLALEVQVDYANTDYSLVWGGEAFADGEGIARLRVPYATRGTNGDGVATAPARWLCGERRGEVDIPEAAVLSGEPIPIR